MTGETNVRFVYTSNVDSDPLKYVDEDLLEAIANLVGENWSGKDCDPAVALNVHEGKYFLCIQNRADHCEKLLDYPYSGSTIMGALCHLERSLEDRLSAPSKPTKCHEAPSRVDSIQEIEAAGICKVKWEDSTKKRKKKIVHHEVLKAKVKKLVKQLWRDEGPRVRVERGYHDQSKFVIHAYDVNMERLLEGQEFDDRDEAMKATIAQLEKIIKERYNANSSESHSLTSSSRPTKVDINSRSWVRRSSKPRGSLLRKL